MLPLNSTSYLKISLYQQDIVKVADFKYGVNRDVDTAVGVAWGANNYTCDVHMLGVTLIYPMICVLIQNVTENVSADQLVICNFI